MLLALEWHVMLTTDCTIHVPQHGSFMTNRKPASARISDDSSHAQGHPVALSSLFVHFHSVCIQAVHFARLYF